jgi:prepilin-type N-terminal cleavage/methylation domain-containing protein
MRHKPNSSSGFTLVEMMISLAIGAMMIAACAKLYSKGLQVTWQTSQRAELQQDFRAAADLLQRDLSMAGAGALGQPGIGTAAIGLPNGAGTTAPVYPCTTSTNTCAYVNGASVPYPVSGGVPYLYSIVPGSNAGITVTAAQGATDIITVNYADITLPLNCYNGTMNASGTLVTFQLPASLSCVLPTGMATPPALNAAVVGLQVGDLIMFGTNAVGVVSGSVSTCSPTGTNTACYTVPFNSGDPGHINQANVAGASNTLAALDNEANLAAVRVISVTYYLAIPASTGLPTLMRIQSGQLPAPVAENVVYLKFSYDVYNAGTVETSQTTLPFAGGATPAMITKTNILHMSMRSQGRDNWSRSAAAMYGGYEGLDLQTSIAARNLTMLQEYPINCATPPCL